MWLAVKPGEEASGSKVNINKVDLNSSGTATSEHRFDIQCTQGHSCKKQHLVSGPLTLILAHHLLQTYLYLFPVSESVKGCWLNRDQTFRWLNVSMLTRIMMINDVKMMPAETEPCC